jgi:plasmid stability protein
MKRTTLFLDAGLERDLQLIAERDGRSTASVVREALTAWVAGKKTAAAPKLRFVAAGGSATADTAERHEELLFREDRPAAAAVKRRRPPPRKRPAR